MNVVFRVGYQNLLDEKCFMQRLQHVPLKHNHKWIPIILTLSSFSWCPSNFQQSTYVNVLTPQKDEPKQTRPSYKQLTDRKKRSKSEL